MIEDVLLYLVSLAILAALAAGYAHPTTNPYVKKYGWILLGFVLLFVSLAVFRRRPGRSATDPSKDIKDESLNSIDRIMERAEEQALLADAQLVDMQMKSEVDRVAYQAQIVALKNIEDSKERRKALIKLVDGAGQ